MSFWQKLNFLVPEPQCRTRADEITEWTDIRPQPSNAAINAVDLADVEVQELDDEAERFGDTKLVVTSLIEELYSIDLDIQAAHGTFASFRNAIKQRYKTKLEN